MKYYLAYGSNLNKQQMQHRCPDAVPVCSATIDNCKLVFRRGYLTIEPEEGSSVPVGIWKISAEDEAALDRYEGYPRFYKKKRMRVITDTHTAVNGMVYVMTDGHPIAGPSDLYLLTVTAGYRDFHLDREPLKKAYYAAKENRRQ